VVSLTVDLSEVALVIIMADNGYFTGRLKTDRRDNSIYFVNDDGMLEVYHPDKMDDFRSEFLSIPDIVSQYEAEHIGSEVLTVMPVTSNTYWNGMFVTGINQDG
jgi:hypothetical protein